MEAKVDSAKRARTNIEEEPDETFELMTERAERAMPKTQSGMRREGSHDPTKRSRTNLGKTSG